MILSLIAARSRNGIIGINNKLPWHLPGDLQHFKKETLGHPVIMGRKTYESIGRALPNRLNIVLTRQKKIDPISDDVRLAGSLEEAINICKEADADEAFVIGGASVYQEAFPKADRIYLTEIDEDFEGDANFVKINETLWKKSSNQKLSADAKNLYDYTFMVYERLRESSYMRNFTDASREPHSIMTLLTNFSSSAQRQRNDTA